MSGLLDKKDTILSAPRTIRAKPLLAALLSLFLVLTILPAVTNYMQFVAMQRGLASLESDFGPEKTQENPQTVLKNLQDEINAAQNNHVVASALQVALTLLLAAMLYRHFMLPIYSASEKLRLIQLGHKGGKMSSTRIAELEEVLEAVVKLEDYISELAEFSDKLAWEKSVLEDLSMKDVLTGVSNRRGFDYRLARAQRGESLAILMIDVDNFKNYNDHFGHQAGDACLTKLTTAMRKALLRSSDSVFRYGGEEFSVILENVGPVQAVEVAGRVKNAVQALRIAHPHSQVASVVTISIGVAVARKGEFGDAGELVLRADKALYSAKAGGRNSVCLYEDGTEEKSVHAEV